jgi:hypothetical protein
LSFDLGGPASAGIPLGEIASTMHSTINAIRVVGPGSGNNANVLFLS